MPVKKRLDVVLTSRGLFRTRSQAAAAVLAGDVLIGPGRERVTKPGMSIADDAEIRLQERTRYVSRGGSKLEHALHCFDIPVAGRRCLDAGASTGGFTDCLLQFGAAHVVALDVAYGALDWRIRNDTRVTVLERRNVRTLDPGELPYAPVLMTADLSFIGLAKVLGALVECAASRFDLVALVKPQFELEPARVGRGGVIRAAADRLEALLSVGEAARAIGLSIQGYCSSGLPGPAGNRESFIWCAEPEREGVEDLGTAALEAEPDALPASVVSR